MGGIDYDIRDKVLEQEVANIKPIVNQGTINNAADEEDLTSENSLLKLKDRNALNGMGYVILRKNKTFAEQVTQAHTIYEVRYDFELNKEVALPDGCILYFNGGSLSGSRIACANTMLLGLPRLHSISGLVRNDEVKASWFSADNYDDILKSCLDSECYLDVDKDISFSGKEVTAEKSILIKGSKTLNGIPCIIFKGDRIDIKGVSLNTDKGNIFIYVGGAARKVKIDIDSIDFDGKNACRRFIHRANEENEVVGVLNVVNSKIHDLLEYGINWSDSCVDGKVSGCTFTNIGSLSEATYYQMGIRLGNYPYLCENTKISHNVFKDIVCVYMDGEDTKETHAIIIYGNNNTIASNYVDEIYSNRADRDPGTETEGLYVKGSYNIISQNTLIKAQGKTHSDGAIVIKNLTDANEDSGNIIQNNIVLDGGITNYTSNTQILGNEIILRESVGVGVALLVSKNVVIADNIFINETAKAKANANCFVMTNRDCANTIIKNNYVKCATMIVAYNSEEHYVLDNQVEIENAIYGNNVKYDVLFYTSGFSPKVIARNNHFRFVNSRGTAMLANAEMSMLSMRNYYEFVVNPDVSETQTYYSAMVRGSVASTTFDSVEDTFNVIGEALVESYLLSSNTRPVNVLRPVMLGNAIAAPSVNLINPHNITAPYVGSTDMRPSLGGYDAGYMYFDSTLKKPIWKIGNNWVDATGAIV